MKILALDPATKTGWAHSSGDSISGVWDLSIKRDESGGMRLIKFQSKLQQVYDLMGIDLVAYEAARFKGPNMGGALVVQSEIQGVLKNFCEERDIEYKGYSSKEIKKHAFGGNCSKSQMVELACEKWSDVNIVDDNHADALWILSLVKSEYGKS